jgi:ferredoxin-thioredoxin reductase catalytic subunit
MTVVKSFDKNSCKLCSDERMEIIKHSFNPECHPINSRLEIDGACHCLPHFHRLQQLKTISANERKKRKTVSVESPRSASCRRLNEEEKTLVGMKF